MSPKEARITFRSGGVRIAMAAASIRQIVPADGITRVPLARQDVAGVVTRDGRAIPVYQIAALVQGGTPVGAEHEHRQIVIVEQDGMLAGFLVSGTESDRQGVSDQPGRARVLDGDKLLGSCRIFDVGRSGDHAAKAAEGDS